MVILGIDVSKDFFDCALIDGEKRGSKKFNNTVRGFEQLSKWLHNRHVRKVHACMEATGGYQDDLAYHLYDAGYKVSIVNPRRIHAMGGVELSRAKTDKADAAQIARFCQSQKPEPWEPPSPAERRLRRLSRRRSALIGMRTEELNRLDAPGTEDVRDSLETSIAFLNEQIKQIDRQIKKTIDDDPLLKNRRDLIESISGVGSVTSSTLLSETPRPEEFKTAKGFTAFYGVCPHIRYSGTSVATSHVTRIGNRALASALYMAAVSAMRCNPVIRAFAERLRQRGKHFKQIVVAVMRKLLVLIYGVLKNGQPFDPNWA